MADASGAAGLAGCGLCAGLGHSAVPQADGDVAHLSAVNACDAGIARGRPREPASRPAGPRFRLQGEFVRDNALAASGLLVNQIGGPSVKPYQPPGLWNEVSLSGNVRFVQDHGDNLYRRSLYIYWKRSAPAPAMTIFSTRPLGKSARCAAARTNTPLQALVTMNDVQFVEAARVLAERSLTEGGEFARRTDHRTPTGWPSGVRPSATHCSRRFAKHTKTNWTLFQADVDRATQLISAGESAEGRFTGPRRARGHDHRDEPDPEPG